MRSAGELITQLEHPDAQRRSRLFAELAAIGPAAVPALCQVLKLGHGVSRSRAAEALVLLGEGALGSLEAALLDADPEVRLWLAWTLGRIPRTEVVAHLVGLLSDPDLRVRRQVVDSLARTGLPGAVKGLCEALRDSHAEVRRDAVEALGRMRDPKAISPLCEALSDANLGVRSAAISALGERSSEVAVPALLQRLEDPTPSVRRDAARALGKLRARVAIQPLCRLLSSSDLRLATAAASALVAIGPPSTHAVTEAFDRLDRDRLSLAADVLVRIGIAAVPGLCRLLESDHEPVRISAVQALCRLAVSAAAPELRRALPSLRARLGLFSGISQQEEDACRAAILQIEEATRELKDLPLPVAPPARGTSLPRPSRAGPDELSEEPTEGANAEPARKGWRGRDCLRRMRRVLRGRR